MAARTPRRSFATPFVVTLAAAPACWVQPTRNPPHPIEPTTQQQQQQQQQAPSVVANPPRPQPPAETENPPPPHVETRWTIYKGTNGCTAAVQVDCGTSDPGMPRHTCNPPPARAYTCPPNLDDLLANGPVTIVGDGTTCATEVVMPTCPPHVMCNPPRPRKVDCPK